MTKKQEKNNGNLDMNLSERDLDNLMEIFLKNKKYKKMEKVLNFTSNTYGKYEYYLNKMQKAKRKEK